MDFRPNLGCKDNYFFVTHKFSATNLNIKKEEVVPGIQALAQPPSDIFHPETLRPIRIYAEAIYFLGASLMTSRTKFHHFSTEGILTLSSGE